MPCQTRESTRKNRVCFPFIRIVCHQKSSKLLTNDIKGRMINLKFELNRKPKSVEEYTEYKESLFYKNNFTIRTRWRRQFCSARLCTQDSSRVFLLKRSERGASFEISEQSGRRTGRKTKIISSTHSIQTDAFTGR